MMELGETDFAALLEHQREKPLNMNFVALYWQQVSRSQDKLVPEDAAAKIFLWIRRCSRRCRRYMIRM
jgi:hypothetical protein